MKKAWFWLILFVLILPLRQVLEFYISVPPVGVFWVDVSTFVHSAVFYICFFVLIAACVAHFARWTFRDTIVRLLPFSLLLLLAPIVDFMFFGRYGVSMSYHFVSPGDFIQHFFSFFGPLTLGGVTVGMRLQVLGILLIVGWVIYGARKSLGEAIVGALVTYGVIYGVASAPSFLGWLEWLRGASWGVRVDGAVFSALNQNVLRMSDWGQGDAMTILRFNFGMAQLWFLVLAGVGIWHARALVRTVYTPTRAMRAALYVALMMLGVLMAPSYLLNTDIGITVATAIALLLAMLVTICAWTYAFVVNDLHDLVADKIVHADRALPGGRITERDMSHMAGAAFICALIGSLLLPWPGAIGIMAFLVCATLYSVPPFKWRRFFALPQLLMALASLGILFFGYELGAKVPVTSHDILIMLSIGVLLFGFWFFKDIGDEAGDRHAGYKTVMTIFGAVNGPRVAYGIFVLVSLIPVVLLFSVAQIVIWFFLHAVLGFLIWRDRLSEALLPVFLIFYILVLFL